MKTWYCTHELRYPVDISLPRRQLMPLPALHAKELYLDVQRELISMQKLRQLILWCDLYPGKYGTKNSTQFYIF